MSGPTMASFDARTVPLEPGVTLVEASAGTGKTFAITRILLRLLLKPEPLKLSQILVVTFTKKATQELVTRIRTTLRAAERVWSDPPPPENPDNADLLKLREDYPDAGRARALIVDAQGELDDLAVFTIHSFCQRVLEESALESRIPFKTTFVENDTEPFGRAANDWARSRLLKGATEANLVAESGNPLETWVKELVQPYRRTPGARIEFNASQEKQALLADFVLKVDETFKEEKKRRHLLGFDDLLRNLCDVLEREGADGPLARRMRSRFRAALIDEFQDTDRTQYPIFSKAFDGCPLFLIGDPKQSIYRFRGADIQAYLAAAASATRKFTLSKNWRSTTEYVQAVDALFRRADRPFLMDEGLISFPEVRAAEKDRAIPEALTKAGGAALVWWWVDANLGTPSKKGQPAKFVSIAPAMRWLVRDIANEIVRLRNDGLPCKSVAVLVRTNKEARQVKRALDDAGLPSVIGGDEDVLESDEGKELVLLASAVAAPHDAGAVRAAMSTRLWGSNAEQIAAILQDDAERDWSAVVERLARAREQWRKQGIASAFGELLAKQEVAERLLALEDGSRRLTNVRHILELLHEAWATDGLAPEGFQAWVARERSVPKAPERRQLRLETDAEAVQVLTIHKCKGLEFDVVFCPNLWYKREDKKRPGPLKGVETALSQDGKDTVLDLGSSNLALRRQGAKDEESQESLRLAYVALTRAKHRCYVAWGDIGRAGAAKSSAPKRKAPKTEPPKPPQPSALEWLLRSSAGEDKRAVLEALVSDAKGRMAICDVQKDAKRLKSQLQPASQAVPQALPLNLAQGQLDTWRISSYSGLTAGAHAEAHSDDARDLDDAMIAPDVPGSAAAATGFRGFRRGAEAGTALHAVLEHLEFARAAEPEVAVDVRRILVEHALLETGSAAERQVADVTAMLRTLCSAPIPGAGFSLAQVPGEAALREWQFHLSVNGLSTRGIADALAKHGSAHARAYAPMLRTLKDSALTGYLKGFVDLALEHEGKWWVMDWKSNWLGPEDENYAPDSLGREMYKKHYTLQYHLYLLALHRHLRVRQPGYYDPARHWGGVAFVFLRGVTGSGEQGWFRDAPTPALLDALDVAVGSGS